MEWSGKNVLITGGLGFVGSNLARTLVQLGAQVTIVDNMYPGLGGNLFNLEGFRDRLNVNICDVNDTHAINQLVRDQEVVYHLAGQVDHVASMRDPFADMQINVRGTLSVLEALRLHNPEAALVFSGTRGQYGASVELPVSEKHPTNPMGVYAVTNLAAEQLVRVYHRAHGIKSTCLRITNTFGPRHQMTHSRYGVVNWFVRLVLDKQPITIMGDGSIKRDLLFIDDLVGGMIQVVESGRCWGEILNVGTGRPTSFMELAEAVTAAAGEGEITQIPFSEERQQLEPGDYWADVGKIATLASWRAETTLVDGLRRTVDYYRDHGRHYWSLGGEKVSAP